MSNTEFSRPFTLRVDGRERDVLARLVMAHIEVLSVQVQPFKHIPEHRFTSQFRDMIAELRALRSLLERLGD